MIFSVQLIKKSENQTEFFLLYAENPALYNDLYHYILTIFSIDKIIQPKKPV
jgi:hypothetical protein